MPTRTIRNEFTLAAVPEAVFEHVRQPQSYVGLSPLVTSVSDLVEIDDGFRYKANERVPIIGTWSIDNPLVVTLLGEEHGGGTFTIRGEVDSPGGVSVWYRYDITPDADGCRIADEMTLRMPFGLVRFAMSRARAVQLARPGVLAQRLVRADSGL